MRPYRHKKAGSPRIAMRAARVGGFCLSDRHFNARDTHCWTHSKMCKTAPAIKPGLLSQELFGSAVLLCLMIALAESVDPTQVYRAVGHIRRIVGPHIGVVAIGGCTGRIP